VGVNWSHKREAWSWLIWLFMPLASIVCAVVFPFAWAHPVLFKVLLVGAPAAAVVWVIVVAIRVRKQRG
jgi:hypothetical protein